MNPSFFGVLVTYRREQALHETMSRLLSQTRPLDRLVVVDNGSDPAVASSLEAMKRDEIEYVDPGTNLGPAGGYALGIGVLIEQARDDDWVFLLDDDDPPFFDDAFEKSAEFIAKVKPLVPRVGGVGISGGRFDLSRALVQRVGDEELTGMVPVDHITGGGLPAYRFEAIKTVGPPLAELFFGFEELEFGLRLTSSGFPLYADGDEWMRRKAIKRKLGLLPPESISVARAERTNWRVTDPTWRRYYSMRNLTYILRSHRRTWTAAKVGLSRGLAKPLLNLFVSPIAAWRSLRLNARAIADGWRGRMGRRVTPTGDSRQ